MSNFDELNRLDRAISIAQEAITAIKVAIAQVESIPNQKAQLNYIAAITEAEKWQKNVQLAEQQSDQIRLSYARERLNIHKNNIKKAQAQMSLYTNQDTILRQKLNDLEIKLAAAKDKKALLLQEQLLEDIQVINSCDWIDVEISKIDELLNYEEIIMDGFNDSQQYIEAELES